jgi:hypothetical protein
VSATPDLLAAADAIHCDLLALGPSRELAAVKRRPLIRR